MAAKQSICRRSRLECVPVKYCEILFGRLGGYLDLSARRKSASIVALARRVVDGQRDWSGVRRVERHPSSEERNLTLNQMVGLAVRAPADLNPILRGWFGYFKQAHPGTFAALDGLIDRRLRSMSLKQKEEVSLWDRNPYEQDMA
jgi:hypothetical protein